jgi:hypothetical protein
LPLGFASYFHNYTTPASARQKPKTSLQVSRKRLRLTFFLKKVDFFALFFSLTGRAQLIRFISPQAK